MQAFVLASVVHDCFLPQSLGSKLLLPCNVAVAGEWCYFPDVLVTLHYEIHIYIYDSARSCSLELLFKVV